MKSKLDLISCILAFIFATATPLKIGLVAQQAGQSNADNTLEVLLGRQDARSLAARALSDGDARRGAMLYYNPELTCVKCHESGPETTRLGPSIVEINKEATPEYLVQSLLDPSKDFTEGFQSQSVLTSDGQMFTGLVAETSDSQLTLVDPAQDGKQIVIDTDDIEDQKPHKVSAMPQGLVNTLGDEQQFLDLVRYLIEVKRGGTKTVLELRPPDSFFAIAPLPEYESDIDHAGMIRALNQESLDRGREVYLRYCARCHGTKEQEGTMPSALRFAEGKFKNGTDPHSMYQTLTHGYGLMVPQRWMVPKQKYDVIHYIQSEFVDKWNPGQRHQLTDEYLTQLPAGSQQGPEPVERTPWSDMDYGPSLINTYEVGDDGSNIAYKGIAIRLDSGPGGVSQGRQWMLYDHDTMRVAAAWSGTGFIDWNGIHFNDLHQVHPRIVGKVHFENPTGPGWADPNSGSFVDDQRVIGRDGRRYGPLPQPWCKYRGLYHFENRTVLNYTVGDTEILETPSLDFVDDQAIFIRTLNIGPRKKPLHIKLATLDGMVRQTAEVPENAICFGNEKPVTKTTRPSFDGTSYLVAEKTLPWKSDMTIVARIKTGEGGTIICQTSDQSSWVPGGKSLFVRGGRLVFDIGWVGAVISKRRVDDDRWHTVALTWQPDHQRIKLFIDGRLDRTGELEFGNEYENPVVRIGYTAEDFPGPQSFFDGEMSNLVAWGRLLSENEIRDLEFDDGKPIANNRQLIGDWIFGNATNEETNAVKDRSSSKNNAQWHAGTSAASSRAYNYWALTNGLSEPQWEIIDDAVCLSIPAGQKPLNIELLSGSTATPDALAIIDQLRNRTGSQVANLSAFTRGGQRRYPESLTTELVRGNDSGPFAVDVLRRPEDNPWACRLRLTGLDFFEGGDRAAVCAWDGSVWSVNGFLSEQQLRWQRIACGLFQPLGLKIVDGTIYVTCRDQIVALEDFNGDGETDYYRCFNSDHQVTEHFHEFAMGLQTDDQGNFYYAKSARHAKKPLVPHHGTLLKVSADGTQTEIVAVGFRAANGVCINSDGSFFVTDQEGHWNPKNRINWVQPSGFYGNMWGYHDYTDSSDGAMNQPLCWITNEFDRSPGELMWVPNNYWGPLGGALLNLSYGMGQIFVVPHESVDLDGQAQLQGGMCALPIPLFPTGVMRGRFNSVDRQLYCCGMYAWAGNQQKPGGIYRVRYTGKPVHLPLGLSATKNSLKIKLSGKLDRESAENPQRYSIKTWDIRRSANYGSPHIDERELQITAARLLSEDQTIELVIPDLAPTRCMEIKYSLKTKSGREINSTIHSTIHALLR